MIKLSNCWVNTVVWFIAAVGRLNSSWPKVVILTSGFLYLGCERSTLEIGSDSMAPTFSPGDRIVIERGVSEGHLSLGDVIAFRSPVGGNAIFVMRIWGKAGDRLRFNPENYTVNGVAAVFSRFSNYKYKPDPIYAYGYFDEYTVPSESLFVVGDNFDYSFDSRVFGPISVASVIGRVIDDEAISKK